MLDVAQAGGPQDQVVALGRARGLLGRPAKAGDRARPVARALEQVAAHGLQPMVSAEACYAADAQGKFWEMHDLIFQHQDDVSREALFGYAAQIGLDLAAFKAALDAHTYLPQIKDDMAAGKEIGVRGTPSFVINGHQLTGAQPIERFREAIDEALKAR